MEALLLRVAVGGIAITAHILAVRSFLSKRRILPDDDPRTGVAPCGHPCAETPVSARRKRRSRGAMNVPIGTMLSGATMRSAHILVLLGLVLAACGQAAPAVIAPGDDCTRLPPFLDDIGVPDGSQVFLSTAPDPQRLGLVLVAQNPATGQRQGYQEPGGSWSAAGNLGPFARDRAGNLYVAPVPHFSLEHNPPEGATTIWRVDGESQVMLPWVDVPAAAAPSGRNPFGVLGLAYGCATDTLYAASVAGSGPRVEVGRIVAVRPDGSTQVLLEGYDGMGMAVVVAGDTRTLLVGHARSGDVRGFALTDDGTIVDAGTVVLDIRAAGAEDDERVRRMRVQPPNRLVLETVPFMFNLLATSEQAEVQYGYRWNGDGWQFEERRAHADGTGRR